MVIADNHLFTFHYFFRKTGQFSKFEFVLTFEGIKVSSLYLAADLRLRTQKVMPSLVTYKIVPIPFFRKLHSTFWCQFTILCFSKFEFAITFEGIELSSSYLASGYGPTTCQIWQHNQFPFLFFWKHQTLRVNHEPTFMIFQAYLNADFHENNPVFILMQLMSFLKLSIQLKHY